MQTLAEKTQGVLQRASGDMDGSGQNDGCFTGGNVPNANWNGKFYLDNGYHPDNANPNLRARVEVSRKKSHHDSFCV